MLADVLAQDVLTSFMMKVWADVDHSYCTIVRANVLAGSLIGRLASLATGAGPVWRADEPKPAEVLPLRAAVKGRPRTRRRAGLRGRLSRRHLG